MHACLLRVFNKLNWIELNWIKIYEINFRSRFYRPMCHTTIFALFTLIYAQDITTFGLGKQMAAIVKYGFDFGLVIVSGLLLLPKDYQNNMIQIWPPVVQLCRRTDLSWWRSRRHKFTSGFGFGDVIHVKASKSICRPNSGVIFQFTAEIISTFGFENSRHIGIILFPFSILALSSTSACDFGLTYQMSLKLNRPGRSHDVI